MNSSDAEWILETVCQNKMNFGVERVIQNLVLKPLISDHLHLQQNFSLYFKTVKNLEPNLLGFCKQKVEKGK